MNIKDLKYLVAISELNSFVKAANQCCISQPTLSIQVKKLENKLGITIFERTNKKVSTTDIGKQIIIEAKMILEKVERIKSIANLAKDPFVGDFRLGAFPTLSTYIFPNLVMPIKNDLPNIKLILIEEKTTKLLQQLKDGIIDAVFLALPINDDSLSSQHIFYDEFKLAVSPDNALASKKYIKLSDLHNIPLLLLDEGHCLRGQALQVCQQVGAKEQQDVRATGLEMLRQMVKAGTGITFMPNIAIQETDTNICYIPFKKPAPQRNIGLVWRKTTTKQQIIKKIIKLTIALSQNSN